VKDRYDIIVVGGGPVGCRAAKSAVEKGVSVLVLEKDRKIGTPVRCAEGVSEKGIRGVVAIKDKWIAQIIRGGRFVTPDGTKVDAYPDELGFILNRELFDADLADEAVQAGAEIVTKAYVTGLHMNNGAASGVTVRLNGKARSVTSFIVIGADGIESRIGRWGGISTSIPIQDMESCVQMTLAGISIDSEVVEFHLGRQIAPGGYLWIFPKGEGIANVGLGISGIYSKKRKPVDYLQAFIDRHFPNASVISILAGGVSTSPPLKTMVKDGLMLVGDAARQANPLTGGGIINGLIAGEIAGRVAAEAVKDGDVTEKRLSRYPREWRQREGKNCERSYKIKKVIHGFSDEKLNCIAGMVLKIPNEKRDAVTIFKTILFQHPKLILDAVKVFT
jgi:digeranylgeranylglycerophospholipid reductase